MGAPIIWRPQYGPYDSLLANMFMSKIQHKYNMEIEDVKIKRKAAELKETRTYNEGREKVKRQGTLAEKGFTPDPQGVEMPVAGGKYNAFKPQKATIDGIDLIETSPGKFIKANSSTGEMINGYNQALSDKSWNPIKTKGNPMSGGYADYYSYMRKAGATPLEDKIALKKTPGPTQEENLKISQERLALTKQQGLVQQQGRAIEAEQLILSAPDDPRSATAVQQFQQNATDQPYMYVTKESQSWYGGKKSKAEKVPLPVDPKSGKQITAKDIMDTMKANPSRFRTPADVLKALGL